MTLNNLIEALAKYKESYGEHIIVSVSTEPKDVKDEEFRILVTDEKNSLFIGLKSI